MHKKAIILLSGGLDSLTCLAIAKSQGYHCYALSFDYGQKHIAEMNAAKKIVEHYDVHDHKIFKLDFAGIGGSALTDPKLDIPNYHHSQGVPITYVPARNTIFLACALGYAETINANDIFIGASSVDYSGYPDCRPEYFKAFQHLATLATKAGVENAPIHIQTPLLYLSKAETICKGIELGIDYSLSISCYRADSDGLACGECDSCYLRKKGFLEAQVIDPTRYCSK